MSKVLVTGATGFIGQALCASLIAQGHQVNAAVRSLSANLPLGVRLFSLAALDGRTNCKPALMGVDVVVHLAARVHVMRERAADPLLAFRKTNVEGSLNLARQAARAGVKRFIFLSTLKVNGEYTLPNLPFTADDKPNPEGAYAQSKYEAEVGLHQIALETGMELVVIRPPLVYGPAVKANFHTLLKAIHQSWPLPLGRINNCRSLVALDNLLDLIMLCLQHPSAANHVFLVSDGENVSTTELIKRLAAAMGKQPRLLPVPMRWLQGLLSVLGKAGLAQRLCGNLQVDVEKTCALLGWSPKISLDEALLQTARHYVDNRLKRL
ncbi:MAG: SDR family oxidoreductase [Methylococcaceae bacterium]|jgi:UDP-glucose 4-epimerase